MDVYAYVHLCVFTPEQKKGRGHNFFKPTSQRRLLTHNYNWVCISFNGFHPWSHLLFNHIVIAIA